MDVPILQLGFDVRTIIRIGVFTLFFTAAAVSLRYNRNTLLRGGFITLFFIFLIIPGFTGVASWPFFPWQLYENAGPTETTFYEMRVVDDEGTEIRYDARAAHPIVGAISRRYARNIAGAGWNPYPPLEARIQSCYFLDKAIEYRERDLQSKHPQLVPRHQRDYEWTRSKLAGMGEFTALRVYRVDVDIAENGTKINSATETQTFEANNSICS